MRTQFAALPFRRRKDGIEIMLLTSLTTGRWIIPKGWPMDDLTPAATAAQEAWEEGGLKGVVGEECVGFYSYDKTLDDGSKIRCMVAVFPLEVQKVVDRYPEAGQRRRKWFAQRKAGSRVDEQDLKRLLRNFAPSKNF